MFPQQIRWQQQNGRSRAAARCRDERLVDIIAIRSAYGEASRSFRTSREKHAVIQLLNCIPIGVRPLHLLHKGDNQHLSIERFGERRHQQRRGRTILSAHDGDLAGHTRVAIGHRAAHVPLAIGDLPDAERLTGKDDRRRQALSKHLLDAMTRQGVRHALCNRWV